MRKDVIKIKKKEEKKNDNFQSNAFITEVKFDDDEDEEEKNLLNDLDYVMSPKIEKEVIGFELANMKRSKTRIERKQFNQKDWYEKHILKMKPIKKKKKRKQNNNNNNNNNTMSVRGTTLIGKT